ncbi:hypothetical protein TCAL_01208, partial [Tigriopus californicus]
EVSRGAQRSQLDFSLLYLTNNVTFALKNLFGEIGAAVPVEVIKFYPKSSQLIVQCPSDWAVKVRASLSLQSSYQGQSCAYQVIKDSATLLSLAQ